MNPYDVLGVSQNASDDDVAKAYKRLAKKYHPDLNPGDEAAAKKMGEINRAYDDIKAMRQRGETYHAGNGAAGGAQSAYGNPFDPFDFARVYQTYNRTNYQSQKPRHSPVGVVLAVMVMIFFVRLLLSILFGGFGGSYYVNVPGEPSQGTVPGYPYGYYETVP